MSYSKIHKYVIIIFLLSILHKIINVSISSIFKADYNQDIEYLLIDKSYLWLNPCQIKISNSKEFRCIYWELNDNTKGNTKDPKHKNISYFFYWTKYIILALLFWFFKLILCLGWLNIFTWINLRNMRVTFYIIIASNSKSTVHFMKFEYAYMKVRKCIFQTDIVLI